jgi:hypothetical protein
MPFGAFVEDSRANELENSAKSAMIVPSATMRKHNDNRTTRTGIQLRTSPFVRTIPYVLLLAVTYVFGAQRLLAQESTPAPDLKPAPTVPSAPAPKAEAASAAEHPFWDATNDWLFAGVAASRTLDYFSTLNMRRRGRQEILLTNDVVDDHAAFAAIEAAGTATSIGVSYLFHHYGPHKLERWTSIVHIGVTSGGAVRNYCLKTAHPAAPNNPEASHLASSLD